MSRVIVTGGAGFIGSNLVDALIEEGHSVTVLDNLSTGERENINPKCDFRQIDITERGAVTMAFAEVQPKYVFHLAALARIQPSIKDPILWNKNNSVATLNILWACYQNDVKKVVFSGSSSVYGDNPIPFIETQTPNPKNPYALSKLMSEQWCKLFSDLYGLDVTVLRYFNVYGRRNVLEGDYATVVGIFTHQMRNNLPLTIVGDGLQRRDLTYIKDVVRANILAAQTPGFGIYNIGTGRSYRIKDIADMIESDTTKREFGIVRLTETFETLADNTKAREELGWSPQYELQKGIQELLSET